MIVPSLPGFGFSGQPAFPLTVPAAAERLHQALAGLGVNGYALHGGDFGSMVADELAQSYPEEVLALHLTDVPFPKQFAIDRSTLTQDEREFMAAGDDWMENAVYFTVQSAQPLTLAYGLTDSPVGLLAWIADKFDAWSDAVDPEDVVAIAALTWLTRTVWSGFRLYADDTGQDWDETDAASWSRDADGSAAGASGSEDEHRAGSDRLEVPTGFSVFPRDIGYPPREYCERFYEVVDFHAHEAGGHFAALERPDALADDIIRFLASLPSR